MSDLDLLQSYARDESQAAFAALVERHLGLVYSAALRQVRSRPLAEEIAQSVFSDLARRAGSLRAGQPLAAWLFVVTRRTAVDVIRRESSRQAREKIAAEIDAMNHPTPAWEQVKDLLDEAMTSLSDAERSAILLRFFENRSLREVGDSLGISEDTAQKRVSRALDRLRELLSRRGVSVSAAGLATGLSAHAIETAPATLAPAIASAAATAGSVAGGFALAHATHTVALTLVQKTIGAAGAAAVLGAVAIQASAISSQRAELAASPAEVARLTLALRDAETARQAAAARLQSTRARLSLSSTTLPATDPTVEAALDAWVERVQRLKQLAAQRPALAIPELAALNEKDWFNQAKTAQLETEEQIRETFRKLHLAARQTLAGNLDRALTAFAKANHDRLPAALADLLPLTQPRLPPSLLAHFELLHTGLRKAVPPDEVILAERMEFAQQRGSRLIVSSKEHDVEDLGVISERQFRLAVRAFASARGRLPADAAELVGFVPVPTSAAALRDFLTKPAADFAPRALAIIVNPD